MRLFCAIMAISTLPAFASYDCKDVRGNTAIVETHATMGTYITITSKEISEFYLQKHNVSFTQLDNVVDPETNKYIAEKYGNDFSFLVQAISGNNGILWGVDFKTSRDEALIYVTDMEGQRFSFHMLCQLNLPVN